jgi:hypothetical protein
VTAEHTLRPIGSRLRFLVFDRDHGVCQLGGGPVTLQDMTLDRVTPGGPYVPENVQAACRWCNERKANEIVPRFCYRDAGGCEASEARRGQ